MRTLELGGIRLHALVVHPGAPGEADRTSRALALADPALVLADLDTEAALRATEAIGESRRPFEGGFIDDLFARESARRFAKGARAEEHPLVAAARTARNKGAAFVALRPAEARPGFFARARAKRAAQGAPGDDPEAFARAFGVALASRGLFDAAAGAKAAMPRLARALDEGRAPVVAVLQAHRAEAVLRAARDLPARRTVA